MRAFPWLVAASVAALGLGILFMPTAAQACSCGPVAISEIAGVPPPANGLVLLTSCGDELPVEQLDVRVDGRAAALVDAGIEVGPYSALLRIEPPPVDGQTVTFDACVREDQTCPLVFGPTEWTVGPVDDAPPMASATIAVSVGDEDDDGISCPPFGPHFIVTLSDLVLDDDVAFVRAELVRERVVTAVQLVAWDASTWPPGAPLALRVFAETDGEGCVQAFAMDRAGNETRLGAGVCEVDPVVVEEVEDEGGIDDRGCACASTGMVGAWGLVVPLGLVFGVRRRR